MATKNILMVAFQFPPMSGSSGLLRAVKFCRYLPEFGWVPTVITANPRMYEQVNERQLQLLPQELEIVRAFGLDTKRHLSFRGRFPRILALPDTSVFWSFGAIPAALRVIRRKQIDAIFTTFPIATAVWIGLVLQRLTRKPWIVDFRDSMTEDNYPRDRVTWRAWRWLESQAIRRASLLLFTAPSAIRMYRSRYPELAEEKCLLLPNGYDEEDFQWLESRQVNPVPPGRPVRLLHLGLIYPGERDPRPFFQAIARLKKQGHLSPTELQIDLRASGNESYYAGILKELDIQGLVHLLPGLPYSQALREAAASDGLLLLQAANCNHQIPAKAYEYLRLGKPIFGLTSADGDTAALLGETGGATTIDLSDEEAVFRALPDFLSSVRKGKHPVADLTRVQCYMRKNQAQSLAESLSRLTLNEGAG